MENIGFKLKKLRESKNISQEELAEELDISQSKLSKIENGRLRPSVPFLFRASQFFSITLSDLLLVFQDIH
ncbi:helix-turn-helix domain-containing protein [Chryseobacterium sp. 3008163]|uniref:helix-turn-helix domain-containing protein n=1 Tax=Chryseobacterium sp. 3008163 TaxID=2478663 RepID=UPI000F0CAB95|nr:helix-turn-helix transcriptional regulator [Chryseobacterium sp. 3008163]AYN00858.1 XRE family transcriptional regulator [Chryseobacterium sp. 3008163]